MLTGTRVIAVSSKYLPWTGIRWISCQVDSLVLKHPGRLSHWLGLVEYPWPRLVLLQNPAWGKLQTRWPWGMGSLSRQHLNLIQHGQIWTSWQGGVCNTYLTLITVPDGVVLCDFVLEPPSAPPKRVHPWGCPITRSHSPCSEPLDLLMAAQKHDSLKLMYLKAAVKHKKRSRNKRGYHCKVCASVYFNTQVLY